jgi:8-oxo-dGTP pyrophosphatase MutT (NUDIX family)
MEQNAAAPADPPLIEKRRAVVARHAASLVVLRETPAGPEVLMGTRGAGHRFMPNRLVFPGGAVERADATAPAATPLGATTRAMLEKGATPRLAHALAIAAARELAEETGLTLGTPPALDGLHYLCRAITPPTQPVRFNARFLLVAEARVTGTLAGSGELENLRFYRIDEALDLPLHPVQRGTLEQVRLWRAMPAREREHPRPTPLFRLQRWRSE